MMNEDSAINDDSSESLGDLYQPSTPLSKDILRLLLDLSVSSVVDCQIREGVPDHTTVRPSHAASETKASLSMQTFVSIIQAFGGLRRETELELITYQSALMGKYSETCRQMAAIISRTYIELGDGAEFADDAALLMIRDLLLNLDDTIIERGRFTRVKAKSMSGYKFSK